MVDKTGKNTLTPEQKVAALKERFMANKGGNDAGDIRGETWNPEPGDILVGTVVAKRSIFMHGRNRENIVVKAENGELWTVWQNKVLEDMFKRVKEGSAVAIEYLGEQEGKHGQTYKNYRWDVHE